MLYNKKFQELIEKLSLNETPEYESIKKDILTLAELHNKKEQRLNKIIKLSDQQQMAILELNEELDSYKKNLEKRVEEEVQKRKKQEEILIEQSRLASIATMIDAVAHQWVQPLYLLSIQTELLNLKASKSGSLEASVIKEFRDETQTQIEHMKQTLLNFRDFFKPMAQKIQFNTKAIIEETLSLLKADIKYHNIQVDIVSDDDFIIHGNPNEFKHIIINIINNAKDEFINKNIINKKIEINIIEKDKKIEITDNAGGINPHIIEDIFELNISYKDNGSGLGLYLSQQIAQKHNGILKVTNTGSGAKFTFELREENDTN